MPHIQIQCIEWNHIFGAFGLRNQKMVSFIMTEMIFADVQFSSFILSKILT